LVGAAGRVIEPPVLNEDDATAEPPWLSNVTTLVLADHCAYRVVLLANGYEAWSANVVPEPLAAVFQPANAYPFREYEFAVRADADDPVWVAIEPEPPFESKTTAWALAAHWAYSVTAAVTPGLYGDESDAPPEDAVYQPVNAKPARVGPDGRVKDPPVVKDDALTAEPPWLSKVTL
jgi:hypothetical protein